MKKILSVFLALMVSAFLLAGCETSPSSISASTSAEQPIAVELSDYSDINQKVLSNVELISSGNEISGHSPELSIEIQAVELFDGGINISLSDSYGTDIFWRYMLDDNQLEYISGPVDKCQKTAETRSGPGRIGNMQIEKDGACHPFKV